MINQNSVKMNNRTFENSSAVGELAFSDPAFSGPAFSDPAFSGPAFSNPTLTKLSPPDDERDISIFQEAMTGRLSLVFTPLEQRHDTILKAMPFQPRDPDSAYIGPAPNTILPLHYTVLDIGQQIVKVVRSLLTELPGTLITQSGSTFTVIWSRKSQFCEVRICIYRSKKLEPHYVIEFQRQEGDKSFSGELYNYIRSTHIRQQLTSHTLARDNQDEDKQYAKDDQEDDPEDDPEDEDDQEDDPENEEDCAADIDLAMSMVGLERYFQDGLDNIHGMCYSREMRKLLYKKNVVDFLVKTFCSFNIEEHSDTFWHYQVALLCLLQLSKQSAKLENYLYQKNLFDDLFQKLEGIQYYIAEYHYKETSVRLLYLDQCVKALLSELLSFNA